MNKFFAILILVCALGLSSTAAYYSIIGLSMLFVGVKLPVIIMAAFLEASKVITAAVLHTYWGKFGKLLKTYLTSAVIIISLITSMGIYGLLSSGYQTTNIQYSMMTKEIEYHQTMLNGYENQRDELTLELSKIDSDVSSLRSALASNVIQYTDSDGNVITTTSSANRRVFEEQLNRALIDRNTQSQNLNVVRDSIRVISNRILETEANSDLTSELGPLIYLSNIVNRPMDNIVNYLMLILIFVFDPLALSLVVTALFVFKQSSKPPKVQPEPIKQVEPKPIPIKQDESKPTPIKQVEPIVKETPQKILKDIKPEVKPISTPTPPPPNKPINKIVKPFKSLFDKSFKQTKKTDVKIY
jgi:hypothetical protein